MGKPLERQYCSHALEIIGTWVQLPLAFFLSISSIHFSLKSRIIIFLCRLTGLFQQGRNMIADSTKVFHVKISAMRKRLTHAFSLIPHLEIRISDIPYVSCKVQGGGRNSLQKGLRKRWNRQNNRRPWPILKEVGSQQLLAVIQVGGEHPHSVTASKYSQRNGSILPVLFPLPYCSLSSLSCSLLPVLSTMKTFS